ncbi:hypothetical protein LA303_13075 [Candidatus Sulfidibacterium hydrothermale]|uniref:glycoside hydrolase family 26 protein n=1 Tax=Candidatus Sulfidibacterium hydrothermale TaxID=2875962 RepID=UPI001F0A2361|nr:glycosyl hydrolase [Candidatus Sulfidibacterium hydrothermale]UBM62313.1 hypothetical protein LA303_13075 [Candidatus Sulfidibacterium hydrothermale]
MKNKIKRLAFIGGATLLGIALVLFFVFLGNRSNGPISEMLSTLGNKVTDVEHNLILKERIPIRVKKLKWFENKRNDPSFLRYPDTVILGVYDNNYMKSFDNILRFDKMLKAPLALIQIYVAWGDKPKEEFPMLYAKAIYDLGSLPLITWEPWLNDFDREKHHLPKVVDPNKKGMQAVAQGEYDFYIKKWAQSVKEFGHMVFIRFGHEMNDPYRYPWGPQNNKPKDFIAAWRHVVRVFKNMNVYNVMWIWAPQPAYLHYKEYYPGNNYVDWVGVAALNYGTVAPWSKWWSFKQIFGNYYDRLAVFGKPLMITEMGSLTVGGNRTQWFKQAFDSLPEKYPQLRSVLFFNDNKDNTTLNKSLDWSILYDTATCEAIRTSIRTTWKFSHEEYETDTTR